MKLLVLLATAVTLTASDPVDPRQLSWQPSGYYYQAAPAQQQVQQQPLTVNWPFSYNPYAQQDITPVQFDRSGVEAQPPIQLRKVLSGGPYVAKVRHYSQPAASFYRGHVEARPHTLPTTYIARSNYEYYGAAKLYNVNRQSEAFPRSRSEVEGRPRGVSVNNARVAYLKDEKSSKGVEDYKVVCYYGAWAAYRKDPMSFRPEMLDGIGCTHVIYAFAALDNQTYEIVSHDPKFDIEEGGYKNTTDLRKTNAGLKVLIAIGGWNEGVKKYSDMVSDGTTRKKFVDSVVEFLDKHDFDGLDLDWEYPGDSERGGRHSDRDNYSLLVEELKAAFQSKAKGWLLTAAVPAPAFRVDEGYDVPRLAKSLDFFNVMTYDLHGSWDNFADHHSPLKERSHDYYPFNTLNSAHAMRHWNQQGAPKNKLVMGIPFYGRSFVLNDEKQNKGGPDSISSGDGFAGPYTEENGFLAYYEICKMIKDEENWSLGKDSDGNVYAYNGKKWVGWDSAENVRRKIRFIKSQGYGGAMTWAIDLDDFNGLCGEKWPLLKAMKEELASTNPLEEVENDISVPDNDQGSSQPSQPDQTFEPPSNRPDFKCPGSGIFSSPYSCNEFYECTPTAFLRKCPQGLNFDPKNRICNWPDQVECNIDPSNDVSTVYSSNVCQTLYDGLYTDPNDCSRMFFCSRGIQSKLNCPYGQTFNAHSGVCSFYSAARCNNGVMTPAYIAPNWPHGPLAGYFQPYATALLRQATFKKGNDKNVVCYFSNWASERDGDGKFVPENVDARLCSHVIYAYANLDSDSLEIVPSAPKVDVESGYYNRIQSTARTQNPQVKVLLGLGGWTDSTNGEKYSKLVTDKSARDNFVTKTVKMLETRGFDGLSLEWNFPVCWQSNCLLGKATEKAGYADLVRELKEAFKSKDLLLSASLSGYVDKIGETAYDIRALGENLDFANVMTYDYHGFWDKKTGHHSPIKAQPNDQHLDFNLEYALNFYASKGFPKSKLNAGLPFYGQSFYLSGSANDVGSPTSGPGIPGRFTQQNGMLSYYEICAAISANQLTKSVGSDSRGPYAYGTNRQWVGYDDVETITKKSNLIVEGGYGGAAVWTIDLDDFNNLCCHGSFPLLNAASEVLRGVRSNDGSAGNCQRPPPVSTPPPPSTESTTWSDGNGDRYPTKPPQQQKPATTTTTTTTTTATTAWEAVTTPAWESPATSGQGGISNGQFCTAENEYYADPNNCQKYFRCVNKRIVHLSCSEGLLWNHPYTQCQWPDTVQCGTRNNPIGVREGEVVGESSTSTTTTTTQPLDEDNGEYIQDDDNSNNEGSAEASKCNDGEYGVVEGECDSYTTCSNGVLYTKLCSPGLHWVQSKLSCDWPEVSGCVESSDNKPSTRIYSGHHIGAGYTPPKWFLRYKKPTYSETGSCETGVLTSHPKDCGSYLFCVHGKYQIFTCQPGTHWNNQQKICDHPESANCNGQAPVDDSVLQAIESPPPAASSTPSTAAPVVEEPDNGQWPGDGQGGGGGGDNSGQWGWQPPVTTTTETTFIETSNIKEPLNGDYKVVCYFTNWAWYRPGVGQYKPNDIDPTICTHVVYGFAVLDPSELIIKPHDSWADLDNEFYLKVTSLKKVGIKVTIAIGGWNDSEGDKYSRLVNNPSARRRFVDHVVGFVEKYNFDGLDLDWEYPSCWQVDCKDEHKSDKEGFAAWVHELSTAFKPRGLLLSAAVSPSKKVIDYAYDVPSIARDLDWISVMTYDYHGHWDKKTGHVAPMYHHPEAEYDYFNTNFTMHYWIEQGAPRDKLIMGMPLYGQAFTLDDPSNTGLNSPAIQKGNEGQFTRQAGFLAYYEICPKIKEGWQVVQDPEGRIGPYAYNGNQWVSFDDEKMIQHKSEYVRKMNLGGGMVWALDLDDFKNVCGTGHHPLMNTIKRILGPKKSGSEASNKIAVPKDSLDTQVLQINNENKRPEADPFRQSSENAGQYKVVCYFTNWAVYRPDEGKYQPEDIDSNLCTHIVYGFAVLNPQTLQIRAHDSYIDFDKEFYKKVSALKNKNKKVLLALGGWNDSEGDKYSRLVSDPSARNRFVTHAVDFLKQHNFDGLDLDWEYPKCWQVDCAAGPVSDKANFADWVKELSDALKQEGLLLTAAVSPSARVIEQAYDIPVLSRYLDYVSVMTYDYHGQWDKVTGHLAPLKEHPDDADKTFNLEYSVKTWLDGGLDKKKLILGFPLYGQSFTLADANNNSLNAPTYGGAEAGRYTRQRGFLSYYEICEKVTKEGWTVVRDPENRMGPYAYKGNQWVSFDDLDTVQQKVDFLKQQDLGGAMVWALDLDDFKGTFCLSDDTYPLLRTINRGLGLLPPARTSIQDQILQGLSENEIKNNLYFRTSPNDGFTLPYGADCSGGNPFTAHEADCAKYFQCGSNGQYEERACAPGLHWNQEKSICDWPATAGCTIEGSPAPVSETQPSNPWAPPPINHDDGDIPSTPPPTSAAVQETGKLVVCYYTNWAWYRPGTGKYQPDDIDPTLCTHINFGFAVLDPYELVIKTHDTWSDIDNKFYERVVAMKNKGPKVLIALGGWNDSEGSKYSRMVNDANARAKFISNVLEFIERFKFDGLDLDWEYPVCWQVDCKQGPKSDKDGFSALVKELSAALKPKGLLLSAAVSPSFKVIDEGYDVPVLNEYLDHINVMTYDYYGHWDKQTGHVAPLYHHPDAATLEFNANFSMHYWAEKGADKRKLIMGMPMYGQTFTLNSPTPNGLKAPAGKGIAGEFTKQEGFNAYYEICSNIKNQGWQVTRDDSAQAERMGPYATKGLQWTGFDDSKTIRQKSQFIIDQGFGGGMIWALDLDDFANVCGCEHYPLLRTINRVLRNYDLPDPGCDIAATPTSSVKALNYVNPSPVYGSPWVFAPARNTPFTSVYYPTIYAQAPALG